MRGQQVVAKERQFYAVIFDGYDGEPRYVTGPSSRKECQRVLDLHNCYEGARTIVSARVGAVIQHCWAAGLDVPERLALSLSPSAWRDLLVLHGLGFWRAVRALQGQYDKAMGAERKQPEDAEMSVDSDEKELSLVGE